MIGSVTKKTIWMILYTMFCVGLMFFIFASLGTYEDHFSDKNGAWYSRESMEQHQYAAYLLTYIVSFPVGTVLSLYDASYIGEKWFVVCVPNFIIYYYFARKVNAVL